MVHKFIRYFGSLIFGLLVVMSACAPLPETAAPTPIPAMTSSPQPAVVMPLLTMEEYGFQFHYPSEYQVAVFQNRLCLTLSQESGPPGPCHAQNFSMFVYEAEGRSLNDVADKAVGNPDIERQSLMVGGKEAILLDHIPAQDWMRMVVIVHDDREYILTFIGWPENQVDTSPEGILYNTVIDSFTFLDEITPQPVSSPTPKLSVITANTLTSSSPYGNWTAEAVLASFADKDYARLTVSRLDDSGYHEWRPYEEWSGTGLGDSFLSDFYCSADGRYLYFSHTGVSDGCGGPFVSDLRRVDLQNGSLRETPLPGLGLDIITISPEADRLAYRTADGFLVHSLETGESYSLPYEWPEGHDYLVGGYAWSPDRTSLAFTVTQNFCLLDPNEMPGTSIQLIDLETGEARILTDRDPRFLTVTGWPEAGKLQVLQDGVPYLYDIDSGTLAPDPQASATLIQ